ncbi:RDD family protein [Streptomyces sp. NPDC047002]|uniref:RDD family protein n=1 Tax=Streptomyces sp. NPDC047002 TaxID=3155475 RepID=UPI003455CFEC
MSEQQDPTRLVGRRCAQFVLDRLILTAGGFVLAAASAACIVLAVHTGVLRGGHHLALWLAYGILLPFIGVPLLGGLANEVWLLRRKGATMAMRVLRLRVVDRYGVRPTLGACLLRWVAWVVDGALFGLVGLACMLATRHHQRLGDLVARTYVVRAEAVAPEADAEPGAEAGHEGAEHEGGDGATAAAAPLLPEPAPGQER